MHRYYFKRCHLGFFVYFKISRILSLKDSSTHTSVHKKSSTIYPFASLAPNMFLNNSIRLSYLSTPQFIIL